MLAALRQRMEPPPPQPFWIYDPKPDVTAFEAAQIAGLMLAVARLTRAQFAIRFHAASPGVRRHFHVEYR